jgi:proteasome lid subunit RPN8/RPN11
MDASGFHHQPTEDQPAANGAAGAPLHGAIPQADPAQILNAQTGGLPAEATAADPASFAAAAPAPAVAPVPAEDDEKTDSDADMPAPLPPPIVEQAPPPAAARPPPAPKPAVRRGGGRGGIITLAHLIDDGIIEPGDDVLSVEYKGATHIAALLPDGRISCRIADNELTFESPSAFSIYLKRLVNPTRKADDGWKTVKYRGRLLEQYKAELARKRLGLGEGGDSTAALEAMAALEPRAAKRARTDGEQRFKFGGGIPSIGNAAMADRPRRQRRAPPRFAAIGVDDEHALQPLEAYLPGEQPFSMYVHPAAEVMMDFHAHMCMNEIIGILAGTWDPSAKRIEILRAYPVRELNTEDDSINVEMDPEDQVAKMEEVSKAGLKVVGWYHSHPTFQAIPSTIDIYNQVLQQHAHREEGGSGAGGGDAAAGAEGGEAAAAAAAAAAAVTTPAHMEPYVAAIISPYDRSASTPLSTINWFYVSHAPGAVPAEGQRPDEVGCIGKALAFTSLYEPLGQLDNLQVLQREMEQLAKRYAEMPDRANLEAPWIDGQLRAEKLVNSLVGRLRPVSAIDEGKLSKFADKVLFSTRAVWNIYGKPLLVGAGAGQGLASAAAAATAAGTLPSSVANPSGGPTSTGISHEGGDAETVGGSEQQRQQQENDEPISDDDDEATDDE